MLVEEGDGDLVFAAGRKPLQQARRDDEKRGSDADLGIGRAERDGEAADAGHDDRGRQHVPAAIFVGERREHKGADRPPDKADGEGREAGDQRVGLAAGNIWPAKMPARKP
jgi:hypothetical protein